MDMKKKDIYIYIFTLMLVDREKNEIVIKMDVVIKEGGRQLLWKLIKKGNSYKEKKWSS